MADRGDTKPRAGENEAGQRAHDPIVPISWARFLYIAVVVVAAALLVVDITHPNDWKVDGTALGLVGLLLVIPLIEQLRKIKFGNLEIELADLEQRVQRVDERLSVEVAAVAVDSPEEAAADTRDAGRPVVARGKRDSVTIEPLDRIVWVDDLPENNAALIRQFSERYTVETATTTEGGVRRVSEAPDRTLVISDSLRVEDGRRNYNAGEELARRLRQRFPAIPIFIFAGSRTVSDHAGRLRDAGADLVTSSSVELGRTVRATTAHRLSEAVGAIAADAGRSEEERSGLDFLIVQSDGSRVGIEARDWRLAPKRDVLDAVWARFADLLARKEITRGYLVLPTHVLTEDQRRRTPAGVSAVTVPELASHLKAASPAQQPPARGSRQAGG